MNWMIGPCDRVRDFLLEYLEHRLPPMTTLRFSLHLRVCPKCKSPNWDRPKRKVRAA